MGLIQSTINVDSGLAWETNLNASLSTLDQHNHTPGRGVTIPPAGLNINSALTFQNNPATALQATVYTPQSAFTTLNALFVGTDGNLYFNDGVGDASIQMTSGGSVNATSSGIVSGSATAAFVSSVLVVNAATNTPANIQVGSVLLGNNSAGSKFVTLSPPSSMPTNYGLVLPSIPSAESILSVDTSGNIVTNFLVPGNQIASATVTGSNIASQTVAQGNMALRATGSTVAAGGIATSASCGNFSTTSVTPVNVTNLSVTITTTGRPVYIGLISDGTGGFIGPAYSGASNTGSSILSMGAQILRGGSVISIHPITGYVPNTSGTSELLIPCGSLWMLDIVAAGTYTYTVQVQAGSVSYAFIDAAKLVAYET